MGFGVQAITAFQQDLAELQQLQQQEGAHDSTGKEEEEEEEEEGEIAPIYEAEAEENSDEAWDHEEWVEQATRATPQGPVKIHRASKGKHDRQPQALWANEARSQWLEPEQAPIDSHTWRDGLVEEDLGSDDDDGRLGRSDFFRANEVGEVEGEAAARSHRSSKSSEAARSRRSRHSGVDRQQEEQTGRDR
jgi:hypothetical protein